MSACSWWESVGRAARLLLHIGQSDGESQLVPALNVGWMKACYLVFLSCSSLQIHFQASNNHPNVSFVDCLSAHEVCNEHVRCDILRQKACDFFFLFFFAPLLWIQCVVVETTDCPDLPAGLHTVYPPVRQTVLKKRQKQTNKQPCDNRENKQIHWFFSSKIATSFHLSFCHFWLSSWELKLLFK